jgi:nucleoid-associated protein YgaU
VIFPESRYANVPSYQVRMDDGRTVTALGIRFLPPTPANYVHTFVAGDRLDLLAHTFYHDARKFWQIADANPEMDPVDLAVPGRQLLIPPDRT